MHMNWKKKNQSEKSMYYSDSNYRILEKAKLERQQKDHRCRGLEVEEKGEINKQRMGCLGQ